MNGSTITRGAGLLVVAASMVGCASQHDLVDDRPASVAASSPLLEARVAPATASAPARRADGRRPTEFVVAVDDSGTGSSLKIKTASEVLRSRYDTHAALNRMLDSPVQSNENLKKRIQRVRSRNGEATEGLRSLGGFGAVFGRAFLRAAERKADSGGVFDPTSEGSVRTSGKITKFRYNPGATPRQRSAEIEVDTLVETLDGDTVVESHAFKWSVSILRGIELIARDDSHPNLFPVSMQMSDGMKARIRQKSFNWKFWVQGGKRKIRIDEVQISVDGGPYESLKRGHPLWREYRHVFSNSPDNCIDMMFVAASANDIPTHESQLSDYSYCLGRCGNPGLINTGE